MYMCVKGTHLGLPVKVLIIVFTPLSMQGLYLTFHHVYACFFACHIFAAACLPSPSHYPPPPPPSPDRFPMYRVLNSAWSHGNSDVINTTTQLFQQLDVTEIKQYVHFIGIYTSIHYNLHTDLSCRYTTQSISELIWLHTVISGLMFHVGVCTLVVPLTM